MKKLLAIFLAALLCLCAAAPAFADGEGPYFNELEAYVQKAEGISLFEYDGTVLKTIPSGTKLIITGGYEEDGKMRYYTSYENEFGFVWDDGLVMDLSPVGPEGFSTYTRPLHLTVFDPAGVTMYVGPGEFYAPAGEKLPKGAEVVCTHTNVELNVEYNYTTFSAWAYGTCNGQSGWVYTGFRDNVPPFVHAVKYGDESNGVIYKGSVQVAGDGVYLYNNRWDDDTVGEKIPAGTTLTFEYYEDAGAYVTYNGVSGWLHLNEEDLIVEQNGTLFVSSPYGVPVYDTVLDTESETERILPSGAVLEVTAIASQHIPEAEGSQRGETDFKWFRIADSGGSPVWVAFEGWDGYSYDLGEGQPLQVTDTNGTALLSKPEEGSDTVGTAAKDAVVKVRLYWYDTDADQDWTLLEIDEPNGKRGWVPGRVDPNAPGFAHVTLTEPAADNPAAPGTTAAAEEPADGTTATEKNSAKKDADKAVKANPRLIIVGCVAAAVVLALVAAVTILLLRKKKTK